MKTETKHKEETMRKKIDTNQATFEDAKGRYYEGIIHRDKKYFVWMIWEKSWHACNPDTRKPVAIRVYDREYIIDPNMKEGTYKERIVGQMTTGEYIVITPDLLSVQLLKDPSKAFPGYRELRGTFVVIS